MFRREQTVDELLVGAGRSVLDERVDLIRIGRKAQHVQKGPPNQGPAVGFRTRGQSFLMELPQDEPVDGRSRPALLAGRRLAAGERPERPEPAIRRGHFGGLDFDGLIDQWLVVRRAKFNPARDAVDRLLRQLRLLKRHVGLLLVPNQFQQPTRVGRCAYFSAVEQRLAAREIKAAQRLRGAMADQASFVEQRPHLALEQLHPLSHPPSVLFAAT